VGGRDEQFPEFVRARWHPLLRTAFLLTGDHGQAEDLLQTALVKAHRYWSRIEDSPEAYVRKVMVNTSNSWWRRRRLTELVTHTVPDRPTDDTSEEFGVREELWAAVLALPPKMRSVLVLRYFEDLPEAEVARILDCSVGTVKSQTSRGLDRLRDVLCATSGRSPDGADGGGEPPMRGLMGALDVVKEIR
jgi:RNA polymerase sigma-70 factor (sigma-E family)